MTAPLVYVDHSTVHAAAGAQVRAAITELATFVEENEPRLISYSVYLSEDGREMTVVHVHTDADSLDVHLDVIEPRLAPFAGLLTLSSIQIYGEPNPGTLERLQDKIDRLGSGDVTVWRPHAGFSRSGSST